MSDNISQFPSRRGCGIHCSTPRPNGTLRFKVPAPRASACATNLGTSANHSIAPPGQPQVKQYPEPWALYPAAGMEPSVRCQCRKGTRVPATHWSSSGCKHPEAEGSATNGKLDPIRYCPVPHAVVQDGLVYPTCSLRTGQFIE